MGFGGAVSVLLISLLAVASVTVLIKMDSRLGIPILRLVPTLSFLAAVAISFGFNGFKQFELLRAESINFINEQEQAANAEGRLWDSNRTYVGGGEANDWTKFP